MNSNRAVGTAGDNITSSAADTSADSTYGSNLAAINSNRAVGTVGDNTTSSAADTSASITSGSNLAAINSNRAVGTVGDNITSSAADARTGSHSPLRPNTFGTNRAAMNSNRAAVTAIAAADARVITISRSLQRAATVRLAIDGKAVSFGDFNTTIRGGQLAPVRQNQVDMAGDGDALGVIRTADGNIAVDHVPAVAPCSLICHNRSRGCFSRACHFTAIPRTFDVRHRLLCRLRPRRNGQEQKQDQ